MPTTFGGEPHLNTFSNIIC
ncbi:hypothetical protein [Staphylococcus aureus]